MTNDQEKLDIISVMRQGIATTDSHRNGPYSADHTQACPIGAIELHLKGGNPNAESPRWERILEYLLKTELSLDRLPDTVLDGLEEGSCLLQGKPTLHRAITGLNDEGHLTREAIVGWLEDELSDEERTVPFGAVPA